MNDQTANRAHSDPTDDHELAPEQRQMVGAISIRHQEFGAGEPVILLHGLAGSSKWWSNNVQALARQFQVYVLDITGFGRRRGSQRFMLETASRYLAGWMDQVDIERAHLIGHSMGGFIAADLAAEHPERVDRLVLVDAALFPTGFGVTRSLRGLWRGARKLPPKFVPILTADLLRSGPVTVLKTGHEVLTTDIRSQLNRITSPTLVIWGEHDTVVPLEIGQYLNQQIPDSDFHVISSAGHNPMWDRPEDFNRLVIPFLSTGNLPEQ